MRTSQEEQWHVRYAPLGHSTTHVGADECWPRTPSPHVLSTHDAAPSVQAADRQGRAPTRRQPYLPQQRRITRLGYPFQIVQVHDPDCRNARHASAPNPTPAVTNAPVAAQDGSLLAARHHPRRNVGGPSHRRRQSYDSGSNHGGRAAHGRHSGTAPPPSAPLLPPNEDRQRPHGGERASQAPKTGGRTSCRPASPAPPRYRPPSDRPPRGGCAPAPTSSVGAVPRAHGRRGAARGRRRGGPAPRPPRAPVRRQRGACGGPAPPDGESVGRCSGCGSSGSSSSTRVQGRATSTRGQTSGLRLTKR